MKNNHLEPTYLRYIYDGRVKGSIHPENTAELPKGLIGMNEEAFDEPFVAEAEAVIQEFISTDSARFNSSESGKYQLN
jgi:hypothetical protein